MKRHWEKDVVGLALLAMQVAAVQASDTTEVLAPSEQGEAPPFLESGFAGGGYASPAALAIRPGSDLLYIGCATANQVVIFDTAKNEAIGRIGVPGPPLGLALSRSGHDLYITCAGPSSVVCIADAQSGRIVGQVQAGHTAMSPVLSLDEKTLYVCNRFNHDISVIDLVSRRELKRIPVEREPVAAGLTPDGKLLLVANHMHSGRANELHATAAVSVIDTSAARVVKNIHLPLGASLLRGLAISPDGRFAAVTHLRSLFWLTTSAVDLGRINCNAVTILDVVRLQVLGTVLLDQAAKGAANPWGVLWTADGRKIVVSNAGSHELTVIQAPVDANSWNFMSLTLGRYSEFSGRIPAPPEHPVRVQRRIPLEGLGPRALAAAGSRVYSANYFSDDLSCIDLAHAGSAVERVAFWPTAPLDPIRQGELLFNDARLCAQGWQSCASCHDTDARCDALNWDLLNDGEGNPKNTKSLVWSHQTPPSMALGIRTNAETAVRAGIHHILFTDQPPEVPEAIDAYLASLQPEPSPFLVQGQLSLSARRGRELFASARTGCAECHPGPLSSDLASHEVGTAAVYKNMWGNNRADPTAARFDTPTLTELWRTGPFLHDGSAASVREVITSLNREDRHGRTSGLSPSELDDLLEYLLSL